MQRSDSRIRLLRRIMAICENFVLRAGSIRVSGDEAETEIFARQHIPPRRLSLQR